MTDDSRAELMARLDDLLARMSRRARPPGWLPWRRHAPPEAARELEDLGFVHHLALRLLVAKGPMTVGELAGALGVTRGAATQTVDRLEALGFAERRRDAPDRRVVRVEATDRARARSRQFQAVRRRVLEDVLAVLSDDELAALVRILEKVLPALGPPEEEAPVRDR